METNITLSPKQPWLVGYRSQVRFILAVVLVIGIMIPLVVTTYAAYSEKNYDQCKDSDLPAWTCNWTPGNTSGAHWVEGSAIPQRAVWTGITGGTVHTYTFNVTWNQGFYHGYDFLVSYETAAQMHRDYIGTPLDVAPCIGLSTSVLQPTCYALHGQDANGVPNGTTFYTSPVAIQDDTYRSGTGTNGGYAIDRIRAFEARYGDRFLVLRANAPITATNLTFYHAADTSGYPSIAPLADTTGGSNVSTLVRYTLVYTTSATNVIFEYAAHYAVSGNYWVDNLAWGWDATNLGLGAAGIGNGSPWHVKDQEFDKGLLGYNGGGSQDNGTKLDIHTTFPIYSTSSYASGNRATDAVTVTAVQGDNRTITGTIAYYVCADTVFPYSDALTNGCALTPTQRSLSGSPYQATIAGTGGQTVTAYYLGTNYLNSAGTTTKNGTSPLFRPSAIGRYCFLTVFTPTILSGGTEYNYPPVADTNGTLAYNNTVPTGQQGECFELSNAPTAVKLQTFRATDPAIETSMFGGFPLIGFMLGLLGIAGSLTVWKFRFSQN